ncbi:hypothetical protein StoSoilA2_19800 [Arthrobacter sp. StoSoilA2]|nr:hypothetical protein StoSoilA2_19800 [Arthrobacter sp. StoSoilA2]
MEFCEVVSGSGFLASPVSLNDGSLVVTAVENGIRVVVDGISGSTETLATARADNTRPCAGPT